MTKKEYSIKSLKLFWFDYLPTTVALWCIFNMFNYIVRYFSGEVAWAYVGVITVLYISCLIFLAVKPYLKASKTLDKEGYEETEEEKRIRMVKWNKVWGKKQKKLQKQWSKKLIHVDSFEDLRRMTLLEIIKWRAQ